MKNWTLQPQQPLLVHLEHLKKGNVFAAFDFMSNMYLSTYIKANCKNKLSLIEWSLSNFKMSTKFKANDCGLTQVLYPHCITFIYWSSWSSSSYWTLCLGLKVVQSSDPLRTCRDMTCVVYAGMCKILTKVCAKVSVLTVRLGKYHNLFF